MNLLPFSALLLAASLASGASPNAPIVDDEKIFQAVERDLRGARSLSDAEIKVEAREGVTGLTNDIRIRIPPSRG